jgi:hypothetical protein
LRLIDVVHWHCVRGDDLPHLLDLCLETGDVLVVSPDRVLGLVVLLLEHLFLRGHCLQLFGERFGGGFELLSFGDEVFELKFVLEEGVLLDLFLAFQFLPVLSQLLQLRLLAAALRSRLLFRALRHRQLVFQ